MNKRRIITLMNDFGDAIVDFNNGNDSILATTDFSPTHIRKSRRLKRTSLKGKMLLYSWTDNSFVICLTKDIRSIAPLSKVLGNSHGK